MSQTVISADAQSNYENDDEQVDLLPEKLSIRQYLDESLMPTLLPALNELVK